MLPISLLLYAYASLTAADLPPYHNDQAFENLDYGPYPIQSFHSSPELAPRPNILQQHPNPDRSLYTFFEPRGWKVDRPGPMIVDADWNLIWTSMQWGNSYNHQVQKYKGKDYLTFWAGDDGIGGHGEGYMFMLDETYKTVRTFAAKNGMMADQHGFTITEQGTLLYTVYETRKANLKSVSDIGTGYIWDCLFQEVDIETGTLLFEWRATEHVPFEDTYGPPQEASYWQPWDWFHINSVDKDPEGNYLVSSRYTHALHYVSGKDGSVLWTLGGKHSSFEDLSDGHASDFCFQHDARWRNNGTKISLYDNHSDNAHPSLGVTKGLLIDVDRTAMTASLAAEYVNPQEITCLSQGAMQFLENGNVFIGYGYCGAFTEFDADGTVLSNVHIGPRKQYLHGNIQSYRARKHHWKGYPATLPDLVTEGSIAYVSWNGATEVKTWGLQYASSLWAGDNDWTTVATAERTGFETRLEFEEAEVGKYLRCIAWDANEEELGASAAYEWKFARTSIARTLHVSSVPAFLAFAAGAFFAAYVCSRLLRASFRLASSSPLANRTRSWFRRRRRRDENDYAALPQYSGSDDNDEGLLKRS